MKVGDLVRQGNRVINLHKGGKPMPPSRVMGMVVAIRDLPEEMKVSRNGNWSKLLGGGTVDVLWFNGRLIRNFAMNSLEIVSAQKDQLSLRKIE
jgi:hypothetical protein